MRMFDPATGMHIEIGASGEFNVRVANSKKLLLKIVGTTGGLSQSQLLGEGSKKGVFRSMVMTQVKSCLAQAIKESGINILEIDAHLINLSNIVKSKIAPELAEYGLELSEFYINRIVTPDDDPNFRRLKQQYAQEYLSVREQQIRKKEAEAAAERMAVEAQTTAKMKIIGAQSDAEGLHLSAGNFPYGGYGGFEKRFDRPRRIGRRSYGRTRRPCRAWYISRRNGQCNRYDKRRT